MLCGATPSSFLLKQLARKVNLTLWFQSSPTVCVSSNVTHMSSVFRAYEHGERLLLLSPISDDQANHLQVSVAPQHTTAHSLVSSTSMHSMQGLATS